jgi:hypothetical protein
LPPSHAAREDPSLCTTSCRQGTPRRDFAVVLLQQAGRASWIEPTLALNGLRATPLRNVAVSSQEHAQS